MNTPTLVPYKEWLAAEAKRTNQNPSQVAYRLRYSMTSWRCRQLLGRHERPPMDALLRMEHANSALAHLEPASKAKSKARTSNQ